MPEEPRSEQLNLNDVHSKLNPTKVLRVETPACTDDLIGLVQEAKQLNIPISVSGCRHAMGGQQFGADTLHISTTQLDQLISLDESNGTVKVGAGITWPQLIEQLIELQGNLDQGWGIIQKQTGADQLTLGGALSANVHGRGLHLKPIIGDVESFTLLDHSGQLLEVSRDDNAELFRLAIGGYGLFGIIVEIELRLQRREKLRREVEVVALNDLVQRTTELIDSGARYGDYQYYIDTDSPDFMKKGVLSAYHPVALDTPMPAVKQRLDGKKWHHLLHLAHTDKTKAFDFYSNYYRSTNGSIYWSDLHQLSYYDENYESYLSEKMEEYTPGSLMISEVYVPLMEIEEFVAQVRELAKQKDLNVIYGTMRIIRQDDESFLSWAREDFACVIFNLRVTHTPDGIEMGKAQFCALIDIALQLGGSFFLTYHRWARQEQILSAYPQFIDFLKEKLRFDPEERFQSEWYRHYRTMFRAEL